MQNAADASPLVFTGKGTGAWGVKVVTISNGKVKGNEHWSAVKRAFNTCNSLRGGVKCKDQEIAELGRNPYSTGL